MTRFKFGGLSTPGLYIDETLLRMCYTHRTLMAQLALNLINEGKEQMAKNVLAKMKKEIPTYNVPVNYRSGSLDEAHAYALLGMKAPAMALVRELWKNSTQYLNWYLNLSENRFQQSNTECLRHFYVLSRLVGVAELVDKPAAEKLKTENAKLYSLFMAKGGNVPDYD